jgi:peptide/nickel transport system substrate-binding protein
MPAFRGGPALSRRALLRMAATAGAGLALSRVTACAGPTGAAQPGTMQLGLNRSLVSLDNKLNQFDAAVTVQRAVRQALTRIGPDMKPQLVLAERFERTGRRGPSGSARACGIPTAARSPWLTSRPP